MHLFLMFLASEPAPSLAVSPGALTIVTSDELSRLMAADQVPLLVDVRTEEEYGAAHVPGAVHIPLEQLDVVDVGRFGEGPVYLIDYQGLNSFVGAQKLSARGVDAVSVDGGVQEWVEGGNPLWVAVGD